MTFRYEDSFCAANELEGYERLIIDAMNGDQSLFTSAAQVQRLWEVSAPLLEHPPPIEPYPPGSWGPSSIGAVIAPYRWHLPDEDLRPHTNARDRPVISATISSTSLSSRAMSRE